MVDIDSLYFQLLVKEIRVWSTLAHPNVLPLLGFVIEGDYPSLVSEWMENGTASQYVKEYPACDLSGLVSPIFISSRMYLSRMIIRSSVLLRG